MLAVYIGEDWNGYEKGCIYDIQTKIDGDLCVDLVNDMFPTMIYDSIESFSKEWVIQYKKEEK